MDTYQPTQWTDQQWTKVQQVVHDEALKSRVAARLLPLCGPLDPDVVTIPAETLGLAPNDHTGPAKERLTVDDLTVLRLATISVNVALSTAQFSQLFA